MKKPSACAPQAEGLNSHGEMEVGETVNSESLDNNWEKAEESLTDCSSTVRGLFELINLFIYFKLFSNCQDLAGTHQSAICSRIEVENIYIQTYYNSQ